MELTPDQNNLNIKLFPMNEYLDSSFEYNLNLWVYIYSRETIIQSEGGVVWLDD